MQPDITLFTNQGYLVVPQLLDQYWINLLKAEEARFRQRDHGALSVTTQLIHYSSPVRQFVMAGPQLPLANAVLGDHVCFTHQQFVTKHPDEKFRTDVPFHQDNGYGRLEPPNDLTVWMTLDDCNEKNGCLWVIPGSQQQGLRHHQPVNGLFGIADDSLAEAAIPLPMAAGDAVIFNSLLIHRSLPNRSASPRVAMYVRYCTPDVVMVNDNNKPVLDDAHSWMVTGQAGIS